MAASVRIEDEAFSDERYDDLAEHAGLTDADHARGKMARLWRQCTIEQRHTLPRSTVRRILGERGVEALVRARLGDVSDDDHVRIRGTKGRIEWLKKLRDNGKFGRKGGRPRKNPRGFSPENPNGGAQGYESETPPAPAPAPAPGECVSAAAPLSLAHQESGAAPAKRRNVRPARAVTSLPDGWSPRQHERDKAKGAGLDADREAERFRNNALAKAHTYADWDAAFRTWIGNAPEFNAGRGPARPAGQYQAGPSIRVIQTRAERERAALEAAEHDEESA
jgi:hypothetical protein